MASISNNSIQLFTHNVNKNLALVVVADYAIVTRAFYRINISDIINKKIGMNNEKYIFLRRRFRGPS